MLMVLCPMSCPHSLQCIVCNIVLYLFNMAAIQCLWDYGQPMKLGNIGGLNNVKHCIPFIPKIITQNKIACAS